MAIRAILVLASLVVLTGATLPETVPVPLEKPAIAEPALPAKDKPEDPAPVPVPLPATVPVPATQPDKPASPSDDTPAATEPETDNPAPEKPKTEEPQDSKEPEKPAEETKPEAPAEPPPRPIAAESDEDFAVCSAALTTLGAQFTPQPRIDDDSGCGIDKPIRISQIITGVKLSPEATVRCDTALELARWLKTVVIPVAETAMPEKGRLSGVNQASGYVCRLRNNAKTGKISEHASGNAIDLVSFSFANGTVPLIIAAAEDSTLAAAFQRALNATACLYFSTVLSPGSDAAHQDHMHLDVLERRGGYRYCR
ncbi:MAG: extensin family protein [Allorhizobium sp.]